jgi:type II secretory pathway pseudopilin PulG
MDGSRMKTAKKMAGFFIVEILVVLLIIGILVTALMPNLTTYTQRAQFVDNLSVAGAIKPAVEGCLMQNSGTTTNCVANQSGIPANVTTGLGQFVSGVAVAAGGIITVTSQAKFGPNGTTSYTYVLTPTLNTTSGAITWAATGTCQTPGLC